MALLSFVASTPRAYRLKGGNAAWKVSTEPGTSPVIDQRAAFKRAFRKALKDALAVYPEAGDGGVEETGSRWFGSVA
jgi:hypothetical protein